jgi:hypothetical protein
VNALALPMNTAAEATRRDLLKNMVVVFNSDGEVN